MLEIILFAAFVMMGVTWWFDRPAMRLDWGIFSKFLGFMLMLTLYRIASHSFLNSMGEGDFRMNDALASIPVWRFMLVFWEDALFVLPMYWIIKKFSKKVWIPAAIAISLYFGYGHIYQGILAVAITSLYPYFLSHKYGIRHGFATVMMCHISYDFITYYTVKFLPFLI